MVGYLIPQLDEAQLPLEAADEIAISQTRNGVLKPLKRLALADAGLLMTDPTRNQIQATLDARGSAYFDGTVTGSTDLELLDGYSLLGRSRKTAILSGFGVKRGGTARIDMVQCADFATLGAGVNFTGISTSSFRNLFLEGASGSFCLKGGSVDDDDTNDPCYYNNFESVSYYASGSGGKGIHLLALANSNTFTACGGGIAHSGAFGIYAENTVANSINNVSFSGFHTEGSGVGVKMVDAGDNYSGKYVGLSFFEPRVELSAGPTAFETTGHCKLGVILGTLQATRLFNLSAKTKFNRLPNCATFFVAGWGAIGPGASDYKTITTTDMGVRVDFTTPAFCIPTGSAGATLAGSGFTVTPVVYADDTIRIYVTNASGGSATPPDAYFFVGQVGAADA